MDNTLLYALMIAFSAIMAIIPFGVFLGLGSLLEIAVDDPRLVVVLFLAVSVLAFLGSFACFSLIQKQNCGSVKNMKQVASNAAMSFGIQAATVFLVWLITPLKTIVTSIFPPDLDPPMAEAVGFGYWSFWSALYGIAIGGTLSGICPS